MLAIVMHELIHWKEMHLLKFVIYDVAYMAVFALYLKPQLNSHTLLRSFGFERESIFVSLYLAFKIWSVCHDYILRKLIYWNERCCEYKADYGAVKAGRGKHLRSALIRNYAANKDALFVNDLTVVMTKSHPSLL